MTKLIVSTDRLGAILTEFVDPLRIPPVLRPDRDDTLPHLTVRMRTTQVQLHSQLPPTTVWAYDGHFPGLTFDIQSGQRLRVLPGRTRSPEGSRLSTFTWPRPCLGQRMFRV